MRMIDDTAFLYEELGMDSFYGSIARIGIMDKKVCREKEGKEEMAGNRAVIITDVECGKHECGKYVKKSGSLEYRMQHWLLDIQLREDVKTARRGNATKNGAILRRLRMMVRKLDKELSEKPMKRFLMANEHDIRRIENLLFEAVASENKK